MHQRHLNKFAAIALAAGSIAVSATVSASGGGGFNQGGFSSQRIDQQYELGKSYYKSPQADGTRLEYCVKSDSGMQKLSRKTVRGFKRGPVANFVDSLYDCANPAVKIADAVPAEQGEAILYYLNKRFKLRLSSTS